MPVALLTLAVYVLHQDFWFWRTARPLVFGVLPIGLFYHAAYTLASSALLWFIVRRHWPSHLEDGHRKYRTTLKPPTEQRRKTQHNSEDGYRTTQKNTEQN